MNILSLSQEEKNQSIKLPDIILIFIFISSSFDKVLNLKISGFSIRICTLSMLLFSTYVLIKQLFGNSIFKIKFISFWSFFIWVLFILAFIPNCILITRGLGYAFWLLIYFCFVISLSIYVKSASKYRQILIWYINSFLIIGLLGYIQFFLGIAGVNLYLSHLFKSGIPRVSLFSYEPSYFSTYLFVGWCFHYYLSFTNYTEFKRKVFNGISLLLLTVLMLLSFSRMGIVFMLLIFLATLFRMFQSTIFTFKLQEKYLIFLVILILGLSIVVFFALVNFNLFISIFEGLPFVSKYWHSISIRLFDFTNTWMIFKKSPLVGYSLGGIAPNIAKHLGYTDINQTVVKNTEGMCIFLEVLAASGVIGFIFFIEYIFSLLRSYNKLKKLLINKIFNNTYVIWLEQHRIMVLALFLQLMLLCLNQNILRNYLWVHIAMVNLSFFITKNVILDENNS